MKAWGSKKIFRGDDIPRVEPWSVDHFSGASVQRPHLWREAPPPPEPQAVPEPQPAEAAEPEAEAEHMAAEAAPAEAPPDEADTLDAIREAARQEGYQAGFEQGRHAGHAAGEQTGREAGHSAGYAAGMQQGRAQADAELGRFRMLLEGLENTLAGYEATLAEPITDLALAVARQVIRSSLDADPARIQAVIREALNALPQLQGGNLRVDLNPDDIELVQNLFAAEATAGRWRFDPDSTIARGGCRIANAVVEVDLTLPERWQRVIESLGRHDAWDGHAQP